MMNNNTVNNPNAIAQMESCDRLTRENSKLKSLLKKRYGVMRDTKERAHNASEE